MEKTKATTSLSDPASTSLGDPASTSLGDPASTSLGDPASTSLSDPASTSLGDPATTGDPDAVRDAMQPYFDANPTTDILYVASDGVPFYELNFAENYQRTLDRTKEVVTINR